MSFSCTLNIFWLVTSVSQHIQFHDYFQLFFMMLEGETLLQYCPVKMKFIKSNNKNVYYSISQCTDSCFCSKDVFFSHSSFDPQRQEGHMQRFIREVNTTSRSCVLWDLEEETDYIIQVQSIGLYGESQASKKVHFRTLKKSDRFPSNSSNQGKQL